MLPPRVKLTLSQYYWLQRDFGSAVLEDSDFNPISFRNGYAKMHKAPPVVQLQFGFGSPSR